jgi:hypothetical protein
MLIISYPVAALITKSRGAENVPPVAPVVVIVVAFLLHRMFPTFGGCRLRTYRYLLVAVPVHGAVP